MLVDTESMPSEKSSVVLTARDNVVETVTQRPPDFVSFFVPKFSLILLSVIIYVCSFRESSF